VASWGKIARRTFLFGAAAVAGGAAFGYYKYRQPYENPLEAELDEGEVTFNPWVKISSDNKITAIAPRAEMGQGISTTLAAFVAEELDVMLDKVTVEYGPASYAYYNAAMLEDGGGFNFWDDGVTAETVRNVMGAVGKLVGLQATGGSTSTVDGFDRMRQAGAAARHMLVAAAAARFGVPASELTTDNGTIVHAASSRRVTYGEVAADAAKLDPPSEVKLKDKSEWKVLGKPQMRVDMLDKVTGAPIFGIDVRLPDMLFGTVRMSPVFGQKPVKFDLSKAEKMPGVVKIVQIDTASYGAGFGVVAQNTWAAFQAAKAIEVEWGKPLYPADHAGIMKIITDAALTGEAIHDRNDGDVDAAFADAPADKVIEAQYSVPYLAHAPMEPMNTTAQFKDGMLHVWSPNQSPVMVRWLCADLIGLTVDKCLVHTTALGGGFGRRGEVDYAMFATLLAKETDGRPVQVTWSREEDMHRSTYRPGSVGKFRARIGDDGMPVAVDMRVAAQNMIQSLLGRIFPARRPGGADSATTDGSRNQPYTIPNYRVSSIAAPVPSIPVSFWRSVGNSVNGFFHEGFMDEIAHAGKVDPVEMRRKLMADFPAAVAVVDKVAEMSNWTEKLPAGKAKGFAFTLSFGSWVAEVVQVADTPQGIKIEKMWIAADVGQAIDKGILETQLTGGAVFGLSAAMFQEITFKDGMVEQSNFNDYDSMRLWQAPEFEVAILENFHKMGGAGEVGTPPAAPALANAIFALTGKRIRSLPLNKEVTFA